MLNDYVLYLVYDANPLGRKKVDEGELCNRVNENGKINNFLNIIILINSYLIKYK